MPGLSGEEVLAALHARGAAGRVLMLTGVAGELSEELGPARVLSKPVDAPSLLRVLREIRATVGRPPGLPR